MERIRPEGFETLDYLQTFAAGSAKKRMTYPSLSKVDDGDDIYEPCLHHSLLKVNKDRDIKR